MYLVSIYERDGFVEASLGGRLDAAEVRALGEELLEAISGWKNPNFDMTLDVSRAQGLKGEVLGGLNELKDRIFDAGAERITTVVASETDRVNHQTARMQRVMEGREEFMEAAGATPARAPQKPWQIARAA